MIATSFLPANRILVIDDNLAIHEDFRKILCPDAPPESDINDLLAAVFGSGKQETQSTGFIVDFADQGKAGLACVERALAEGRPYSMAFVDIRMPPGWDGVETIVELWKCDPALQIVISSAHSDYTWQEIISKVENCDQLVILKKPFDNIEVMQLAHAMTRKWEVTRKASIKTAELQAANTKLAIEVAERKAAQDALQRTKERFAKAFNFNPLPIAIIRHGDLVCGDVNSAFVHQVGATREDLIGRRLLDVAIVADANLRGDLENGTPIAARECSLRTMSGSVKPARIWTESVDIDGFAHSLVIVEDLSAQQVIETRLHQAQKMESAGQLAAGIAHDFNNLLTVIRGHASLRLESKTLPPSVSASFHAVNDAASRAATLTQQLLAYSRKQVMQPKVIRLGEVFAGLAGMLRKLVPENIEIEYQFPEHLPPVYADVGNFEQVIVNLVLNARDAMPDGGKLAISAESLTVDEAYSSDHPDTRPGRFLRLSVKDTGRGIPDSIREKIFEPFFTTKAVGEGTGMGLATAVGIIKQHNGWIDAAAGSGDGAIFHIFLPVNHEPAKANTIPASPPDTRPAPAATSEVRNILIVEDDPAVRDLATAVLVEGGYRVLEAPDGPTGLAAARAFEGTIHLLLADMVMPGGLSGKDVAERLAPERPAMKVIFSSGYSFGLFGADMQLLPGQSYLAKPYLSRDLIDAVSRCLDANTSSHSN